MKVKLDENIPLRRVDTLAALGHHVDTVAALAEGLASFAGCFVVFTDRKLCVRRAE